LLAYRLYPVVFQAKPSAGPNTRANIRKTLTSRRL